MSEKLVNKYDDLAQVATNLSKLCDAIQAEQRHYPQSNIDWREFRLRLGVANEGIAERRFRLAFAGGFSVGKSYLVSMFLGRPGLLPSYNKPTTGVVTCLRKGSRQVLEIHYWSRSDSDEMQRYYLDNMGIASSLPVEQGRAAVEAARSKLPPEKKNMAESYFNLLAAHEKYASKLGTVQEVPITPIKPEHMGNPSNKDYPHLNYFVKTDDPPNQDLLRTIKQVIFYVDSEYLTENVEVVDLPGAGAFDPIDTYIQRYFLKKTDGVTVVTAAQRPFDEQENVVVDILRSTQDELRGRAFIALTMFDRLAGPELEPSRLAVEYQSIKRNVLQGRINLPDAPLYYVSPFVTYLDEKVGRGEKLSGKEQPEYDRFLKIEIGKTGDAELDSLLEIYKKGGGLPAMRRRLLEHFRSEMVKLKLMSIVKIMKGLAGQLEAAYKPKWETAKKSAASAGQLKIVNAIKFVHKARDDFRDKSARFRKEQILKRNFDKVFEQVLQRLQERVKLHLAGCTDQTLRQEFEGLGGGKDPKDLLVRFREQATGRIIDDFHSIVWDRNTVPTPEPEAGVTPVAGLAKESTGLLRKHVRDGYYAAIAKEEVCGLVNGLLPHNPEESAVFKRIFDELDLCLEITTDNFVTREALDMNEPVDSLAQGCAGYPDWAKRYQTGLLQILTDKLQRYCKNMQGYLWNLFWKHILAAEERAVRFLESDELLGLVTVSIDDIVFPADGKTGAFGAGSLMKHFEQWHAIDAQLTTVAGEIQGA